MSIQVNLYPCQLYLPAVAANKDLTLGRVNLVAGEGANLEPKCMHPSIHRIHPSYFFHPSTCFDADHHPMTPTSSFK